MVKEDCGPKHGRRRELPRVSRRACRPHFAQQRVVHLAGWKVAEQNGVGQRRFVFYWTAAGNRLAHKAAAELGAVSQDHVGIGIAIGGIIPWEWTDSTEQTAARQVLRMALSLRPAVIGTRLDNINLLKVVASHVGDEELAPLSEAQVVRVSEARGVDLGQAPRRAKRVGKRDGIRLMGALERVDAQDLAQRVVALSTAGSGALHGAVAVGDIQVAPIEGNLFNWVVKYWHCHPQHLSIRPGQHAPLLEVVSKLEYDAVGARRDRRPGQVAKQPRLEGHLLHGAHVQQAVGVEIGVKRQASQPAVHAVCEGHAARRGAAHGVGHVEEERHAPPRRDLVDEAASGVGAHVQVGAQRGDKVNSRRLAVPVWNLREKLCVHDAVAEARALVERVEHIGARHARPRRAQQQQQQQQQRRQQWRESGGGETRHDGGRVGGGGLACARVEDGGCMVESRGRGMSAPG
ncbi:hypothetical protein FGB62_71g231 [Gracilaria domingensis]|nr:hypothetical protein FGB62_71g231 [Gracilaria domingensis]